MSSRRLRLVGCTRKERDERTVSESRSVGRTSSHPSALPMRRRSGAVQSIVAMVVVLALACCKRIGAVAGRAVQWTGQGAARERSARVASGQYPFAGFAFVPAAASSSAAAAPAASTVPVRKRKRTTTVVVATGAASGGGGLEAAAATAAASLSGLTTHSEFVAALEAVTGDPLEPTGGRIVVYRGNPQAKLMVIGEAPGETEDQLGKPFVGKAGQLLDQILQSVNFDTERDVYISNVVRRRPPNNRNPLAGEVDFFLPWLLKEIELINPHIILLAGSFAMRAILEGEKRGITKIRGEWFERRIGSSGGVDGQGTRLTMPVFHPSYLLRNQSKAVGSPKYWMWQDIQAVRKRYDELTGAGGP